MSSASLRLSQVGRAGIERRHVDLRHLNLDLVEVDVEALRLQCLS
jgi:hypothetical protein